MNRRTSYLAVWMVAALAAVPVVLLPGCDRAGGMSKAEMDRKVSKAGFFIDPAEPVNSSDPPNTITRVFSPTPTDGRIIVHTLKYQNGLLTSEVRLDKKPSSPVVAKFFYGFDGKPIVSQTLVSTAPEGLIELARKEFEKIVGAFTK